MVASLHATFVDYDISDGNRVKSAWLNPVNLRLFSDVKNVMDMGYDTVMNSEAAATANGNALAAALATGAKHIIIPGPASSVFYVDRQFYMTTADQWLDIQGTLKLVSNSTIFNDYTNNTNRYLVHMEASRTRLTGIVDGNSPNNTYVALGVTYYYVSAVGNVRVVGGIVVGFVNTTNTSADIYDVSVDAVVQNHSGPGIDFGMNGNTDTFLQAGNHYIWNSTIKVKVIKNQGVGCAPSYCVNCMFDVQGFLNYTYAFQFYLMCVNCSVTGGSFFSRALTNSALVNPTLIVGSTYQFAGAFIMGKTAVSTHQNCIAHDVRLYGTYFTMQAGLTYCSAQNVNVYKSELTGFNVNPAGDTNFVANEMRDCRASLCDQSGFYLDSTLAGGSFTLTDCYEWGNCTTVLSPTYNGRTLNCGMARFDSNYVIRYHRSRKIGTKPVYGMMDNTSAISTFENMVECDLYQSGNSGDLVTNTGVDPPVLSTFTKAGNTNPWSYQSGAVPTGSLLDTFPANATGVIMMTCGAEYGLYAVDTDGATTTVTGITLSANAKAADTAGNACVYAAAGNTVNFKNRLAGTEPVAIVYNYQRQ